MPLSARKLAISECLPLVERIVSRVKSWTFRYLFYADRVQLIKNVLFEMQNYWAQVFLLPNKVLNMATGICRNFLWHENKENSRRNHLAWDTVCQPSYSKEVWGKLLSWMSITRQNNHWDNEVSWLSQKVNNRSSTGAVLWFLFTALVYHIWVERNNRRFQQTKRKM